MNDNDGKDDESTTSSNITTPKSSNPTKDDNLFWNGNYPTPIGPAALALSTVEVSMQLLQADKLTELVQKFPADFQNILAYSTKVPFMIHLPGKGRKIRIIHNIDVYKGRHDEEKLIGMYNDSIEDLRPPELASIDKSLLLRETFKLPGVEEYEKSMKGIKDNEGKGFVSHAFTKTSLRQTFVTGRMVPLPAYLIYDGLEDDLDSLVVYERLRHEAKQVKGSVGEDTLLNAAMFVRLGLVTPSQKEDIRIPMDMMQATLPREALLWRITQLNEIVTPEAERALSQRKKKDRDERKEEEESETDERVTIEINEYEEPKTMEMEPSCTSTGAPPPAAFEIMPTFKPVSAETKSTGAEDLAKSTTPRPRATTPPRVVVATEATPTLDTMSPTVDRGPAEEAPTTPVPPSAPRAPPVTPGPTTTRADTLRTATAASPGVRIAKATAAAATSSPLRGTTAGDGIKAAPAVTPTRTRATTASERSEPPPTTSAAAAFLTTATASAGSTLQLPTDTFLEILKLLQKKEVPSPTSTVASSSSDDDDATLGLPTSTYENLLAMCGLPKSEEKSIPSLWKSLAEKKLNKAEKNDLIRYALQNQILYKGCKVPCIQPIINMIRERNFQGEQSISSLVSAVKGLSPFAVPQFTQQQIDLHNEYALDLEQATLKSRGELAANKLQCSLPTSFEQLVKQLKRFANLIFAVFGAYSPLLIAIQNVIGELEEYNETAIGKITRESTASILWIVMIQSRHFAAGQMAPPEPLLPAFQNMIQSLQMRQPVQHGDVPLDLYVPPPPPKAVPKPARDDAHKLQEGEPAWKRQRTQEKAPRPPPFQRPEIYNAKMKKAMATFQQMRPRPSVMQLCRAANTSANALFPGHPNVCVRSQLWGACEKECKHQHTALPDHTIDSALQTLGKVIQNPGLLNNKV